MSQDEANLAAASKAGSRSLVWDWPLRVFHWALLASVATSWIAIEVFDNIDIHVQSGQIILGLLVFRLLWGLFGPASAQFHHFIRGPRTIIAYLKGLPVSYLGHNPIGALSVVAMLASLIVQVVSGLCSDDDVYTTGPLTKYLSESQVALANLVHEWNQKVLLVLIATHVIAIFFYLIKKRTNLITPMLSGRSDSSKAIKPRPAWLAIVMIVLAVYVAWAIFAL